ncbi:hypothetical protein THIOM_005051 [Candidatus Thiomargarita nelsonii]|uniref:Transposase n=1 Tax=Candidatus Thiomargarita nelsonii TaxID=1003181 RepID=A0A176RU80_9GAMM|nr:hypothetical protein THIOM_005051 [Candidatus Thiomargarita nelsonii]
MISTENPFTFDSLVEQLRRVICDFPDKRTGKKVHYNMCDIALSAFSLFFTQNPSFLQFQRDMEKTKGKSNAQSLFQIDKVPSDNHIRDIMDVVKPELVYPVFNQVFNSMNKHGHFDNYRCVKGDFLIALDGTDYHNSKHIHCENGNITNHRNGTKTYSHKAILPVLVAPGKDTVISLEPEFIIPQDGHNKPDCEPEAVKRWLTKYSEHYSPLGVTLLGDDLFCDQPIGLAIKDAGFNFILVGLPDSHKTLYSFLDFLSQNKGIREYTNQRWTGRERLTDTYRFVNEVPIRDGQDALMVNWCEITTTKADGTIVYQNAFATNHSITEDNVMEIVADGRSGFQTENENHKTLKTKGYHLEHNFGHGKKHRAKMLVTLNVLAFLFHTVLSFFDHRYQQVRQVLGARKTFFDAYINTIYVFFQLGCSS